MGQFPGQPAQYPGFGTPPPVTPVKKKNTGLIVGLVALGAIVVGGGIAAFAVLGGDDDKEAKPVETEVSVVETPALTTVPPVESTIPPITLPPTTVPPETTTPPVEDRLVDLGGGLTFTAPDGYTIEPGPNGEVNLSNGTAGLFMQVLQRTPGEDPLVLIQEYVNTFDTNFEKVAYTQSVLYTDSSTTPLSDGAFVFYRVLNPDGTGFDGAIDVNRRADGLVLIADRFVTLEATDEERFPGDLYDSVFADFYELPSQGNEVPLPAMTAARITTVHTPLIVDGLVALTPPAGWVVDNPGPGRVVVSDPAGQRWVSSRLADTTDVAVAQAEAQAELLAVVPDAVFEEPVDVPSGDYSTRDVNWTGTAPNGGELRGVISVWVHPTFGDAWAGAYSFRADSAPAEFFLYEFLLQTFDRSIIAQR
jgi:hypothetical protein